MLGLSLWIFGLASAQTDTIPQAAVSGFRKSSLLPLPIVYFTPETGWAGGLALFAAFRMPGQTDKERPSQAQLGFAYTQRKQLLFYVPFQVFWNKEKQQVYGELGYYRYIYFFYGIGNENPVAAEEAYDVHFPRIRINYVHRVLPHQYVGMRYWWDNFQIQGVAAGGLLAGGQAPGSRGGVVSGIGPVYVYDNRDDIFFPSKGILMEAECFLNGKALGSDFNFSRVSVDAAAYYRVLPKGVLALNAWLSASFGVVPFQQLAQIGGPRRMRGYFEGRLRDKCLWMAQAEYRWMFAQRFGLAFFAGAAAVSPEPGRLFRQKVNAAWGGGIRFRISKKERVNLRLDFASNADGEFFPYLTLKEAF